MKKRNVKSNKGWNNLADKSALDKPGKTVTLTARITPEQREWLDNQPEGMGYHVRQALQMYINSISIQDITPQGK